MALIMPVSLLVAVREFQMCKTQLSFIIFSKESDKKKLGQICDSQCLENLKDQASMCTPPKGYVPWGLLFTLTGASTTDLSMFNEIVKETHL